MSKETDNESFVRAAQARLGVAVDGWAGPKTLAAFQQNFPDGSGTEIPPTTGPVAPPEGPTGGGSAGVDARSAKNIATLEAKARPSFERIAIEGTRIAREMGATGYVMISGTRTYAEQDALYAKGRTAPGSKVTNARAGYSNHNFGNAGDFGVFSGSSYLDSANPSLASRVHKAVAAWVKANLPQIEWGGDWTSFRDEPHYQYRTGLSLAEMRARVAAGKTVIS